MTHLLTSLMLLVAMSTTNSKGKQVTKHYAVVNGYLCTISKTVINKITLCKRYNCKLALGLVRNKKTHVPMRVILD